MTWYETLALILLCCQCLMIVFLFGVAVGRKGDK